MPFNEQAAGVAQFELMRAFILLLLAKKLVQEEEMKVALTAAGERIAKGPHDEATGRAAVEYINKIVRSLRPGAPPVVN